MTCPICSTRKLKRGGPNIEPCGTPEFIYSFQMNNHEYLEKYSWTNETEDCLKVSTLSEDGLQMIKSDAEGLIHTECDDICSLDGRRLWTASKRLCNRWTGSFSKILLMHLQVQLLVCNCSCSCCWCGYSALQHHRWKPEGSWPRISSSWAPPTFSLRRSWTQSSSADDAHTWSSVKFLQLEKVKQQSGRGEQSKQTLTDVFGSYSDSLQRLHKQSSSAVVLINLSADHFEVKFQP